MNERIRELIEQCTVTHNGVRQALQAEKFAELIVKECCVALNPMLRDMISRGQAVHLIYKHFGVEE